MSRASERQPGDVIVLQDPGRPTAFACIGGVTPTTRKRMVELMSRAFNSLSPKLAPKAAREAVRLMEAEALECEEFTLLLFTTEVCNAAWMTVGIDPALGDATARALYREEGIDPDFICPRCRFGILDTTRTECLYCGKLTLGSVP